MGKFASVLYGDVECWKQNPLLERPPPGPGDPIVELLLPPPPSTPELELAFGMVGQVLETTLDKLKETVLGMLEELHVDCRKIEVGSIVHFFLIFIIFFLTSSL